VARRPDPERPEEQQRQRERAPSGHVLRIPPQRVLLLLNDLALLRALEDRLDERGVSTTRADSAHELVHLAGEHPPSAVLTHDRGDGVPGGELYARLRKHHDARLQDVPMVILHEGRTHELTRYEENVRLVRAPIGARALASVVCTVLAQRPHVVVRPAAINEERPRAPSRVGAPRVPVRDRPAPLAGVLRAIRGELEAAVAHVSAQVERVGERFEVRCAEPFTVDRDVELVLRVRWTSLRAERFAVDAEGELPAAQREDRLTLLPQRGLRGRLTALLGLERTFGDAPLDDAFLIHGDDDGLSLLDRARQALLTLADHSTAIEQHEDRLCVALDEVPRHGLAAQVEAAVELWRAAHRLRHERAS
jgi:CheY-like chemotaxis protein